MNFYYTSIKMKILKTEQSRFFGVDLMRTLAMMMVVGLHTILVFTLRPDFFATKTWFFFEPFMAFSKAGILLFFMLSGYLVIGKNRSIKENWESTRNRILIPLLFLSIIDLLYKQYRFLLLENNPLLFWQKQLQNIPNFPDSSLWFLGVLFYIYLFNPVWQIIFSKEKSSSLALYLTRLSFIFSLFVTIIKFPCLRQSDLFNSFTSWLGYLSLYFYGGLVRNGWINNKKKMINIMMVIFGLLGTVAGDYYTSYTKIHSLPFIWSGYFFEYLSIPNVLLAIGTFNLLIVIKINPLQKNLLNRVFINIIRISAGLSYGIYLIHPFIINIFYDILGFDFDKLKMNIYAYNILNYSLVLGVSILISYLVFKTPGLRLIIGEYKQKRLIKSDKEAVTG